MWLSDDGCLTEEEEMFSRILVPLDGSGLAERVFPGVTELASAFGSEVVIASVCGPGDDKRKLRPAGVMYLIRPNRSRPFLQAQRRR